MNKEVYIEQLEMALSSKTPFDSLYSKASELRNAGFSQVSLYYLFTDLMFRHKEDKNEILYDVILDVLDCINGGGWAKGKELFANKNFIF